MVSDLWLVIPTGARTQYLQDIFKECDIEPSKRVLVRTLPDDDVPNAINLHQTRIGGGRGGTQALRRTCALLSVLT